MLTGNACTDPAIVFADGAGASPLQTTIASAQPRISGNNVTVSSAMCPRGGRGTAHEGPERACELGGGAASHAKQQDTVPNGP